MSEVKKVTASWCCELLIECPYCDNFVEYNRQHAINNCDIPGLRGPESRTGVNYTMTCDNDGCGKEFIIEDTEF